MGVGIAGGVEPVAGAVLAPARRVEQPVDQLLVGVGRRVVDERLDELGRRRQAGEVEAQPAGERPAVGLGGRAQAVRLELRQDEPVDRVADPRRVLDLRQARAASARSTTSAADTRPRRRSSARSISFCRRVSVLVVVGGGISSLGSLGVDPGDQLARLGLARRRSRRPRWRPRGGRAAGRPCARRCRARGTRSSSRPGSAGCRGCIPGRTIGGRRRAGEKGQRRGREARRPRPLKSARTADQAVASTQLPGSVGTGRKPAHRRRPWPPPDEASCGR